MFAGTAVQQLTSNRWGDYTNMSLDPADDATFWYTNQYYSTTGQFRDDFEKSKNDFLMVMKDSKVVTKAEVKATAVENMTKDSADVLVAASSQISNSASAQQPPRGWRLYVSVQRDDGQLKMSKVEFVP